MTALSQRQFAAHVGRSNVWVSKLVKAGKLPIDENGKIPLEAGIAAFNASQRVGYDGNREHAEKQRSKSKPPSKAAAEAKPAKPAKPARAKKALPLDLPATALPDDDEELPRGVEPLAAVAAAFNRARTAEKTYQAKLKQLEYEREQGLYLSRAEVEKDASETGSAIIERLRSLPPRVAVLCEGKPAREIEAIVDGAINEALEALQKSRFARGG